MKGTKILKAIGMGFQVLGAIGGIVMAGFEINEGVNKIKDLNENQINNDSVAPSTEVEA